MKGSAKSLVSDGTRGGGAWAAAAATGAATAAPTATRTRKAKPGRRGRSVGTGDSLFRFPYYHINQTIKGASRRRGGGGKADAQPEVADGGRGGGPWRIGGGGERVAGTVRQARGWTEGRSDHAGQRPRNVGAHHHLRRLYPVGDRARPPRARRGRGIGPCAPRRLCRQAAIYRLDGWAGRQPDREGALHPRRQELSGAGQQWAERAARRDQRVRQARLGRRGDEGRRHGERHPAAGQSRRRYGLSRQARSECDL